MDYSKYIQMKMKAANTYKSNWQGRDASEVTLRRVTIGNKNNSSTHAVPPGVVIQSCSTPCSVQGPGSGYSTDYSMDPIINKTAGCVNCNDPVWGTSGGVNLISCAEVTTILKVPSNPIKGTNLTIPNTSSIITYSCECADTSVVQRGVEVASDQKNSSTISGKYTGWRNQTVAPNNGSKPSQSIPFPSG